jgi:type IV pilus biogenesis protein CpaD/CtpE
MHSPLRFRRVFIILPVTTFVAAMLSGCAQGRMSQSNGSWHESNVVWQNLAAQVADSHDLVAGHGDNLLMAEPLVAPIVAWSNTKPAAPTVAPETSLSNLAAP